MTESVRAEEKNCQDAKSADIDPMCPRCGSSVDWVTCWSCDGEGMSGHDCGEDTCCCADPVPNVPCDVCDGKGGWWSCLSSDCQKEDR